MTAVVLIAVMVDRRAVTFRTLAVAAMIVLVLAPEALVHPSFQMSFAATLGLVALVQIGMPRLFASPDHSATAKVALWGGREMMTLLLASLVAGLATTPYAAFHFHRVTPYGVLANLAAMPVVSALVMPAGLLGLLAMPFGLDGVFWWLMGVGIDWMIVVTEWVAALPGAIGRMAAFGIGPLIAASVGIVLLGTVADAAALVRRGHAGAGDGVGAGGSTTGYPDFRGRPQCRRSRPGRAVASDADRQGCVSASRSGWLPMPIRAAGGCVARGGCFLRRGRLRGAVADGALVTLALQPDALADDCARAALIVTAKQPPPGCAASLITLDRLRRQGTLALRRTRDGFAIDGRQAERV